MAEILPFCGLRYNHKKIKDLSKTFAPPYDVISAKEQNALYKQHSCNVIRLILGKESKKDNNRDNRYTRAGRIFKDWIKTGVLIRDENPCIYIYTQDYSFEGKAKKNKYQ